MITMNISRRVAATLSGLVLAGTVTSGSALAATGTEAQPVTSTAPVAAMTDPSDGFCNADEAWDVKLGGDGHLYECSYVPGLGWYWQPY
jgi:hypothetical protein